MRAALHNPLPLRGGGRGLGEAPSVPNLRCAPPFKHRASPRPLTPSSQEEGERLTSRFYNEIAVRLPKPAQGVVDALAEQGVIAGVAMSRLDPKAGMDDVLITCATEMNTHDDIATYTDALKKVLA